MIAVAQKGPLRSLCQHCRTFQPLKIPKLYISLKYFSDTLVRMSWNWLICIKLQMQKFNIISFFFLNKASNLCFSKADILKFPKLLILKFSKNYFNFKIWTISCKVNKVSSVNCTIVNPALYYQNILYFKHVMFMHPKDLFTLKHM